MAGDARSGRCGARGGDRARRLRRQRAAPPLSKPAYDAAMVKIGKELESDLNPVYSASTPTAAAAALTIAQRKLGTAEHQLAALVPPSAVKADGAKLDAALKQYIVALDR